MPSVERSRPVILVADDEPFILQYIQHVLEQADYDVIPASSVEQALAILRRRHPEVELVLSDIVMPGSIDGLELAERIHQLDPDLPVLFISGALSEVDSRTAQIAEKQLLLAKPFHPKELVEFVSTHMRGTSFGIAR